MRLVRTVVSRLALLLAVAVTISCDEAAQPGTFIILSVPENKILEPLVQEFCAAEAWKCRIDYKRSIDIKLALEVESVGYDAVWPAHGRWIEMGDTRKRVKHARTVMTSPVVFGIRESVAERLGIASGPSVTTAALLDLIRGERLGFIMPSATQSNSGFLGYIGFLATLASRDGEPGGAMTAADLENQGVRNDMRGLLGGMARTSGGGRWLTELYLAAAREGAPYDAMVNYEAMLIEANQTLEAEGRETLRVVYPSDGVAFADSLFGFVGRDVWDAQSRERFFLELRDYLTSSDAQAALKRKGWRANATGTVRNADPRVFRADWGIVSDRPIAAIPFPEPAVISEALTLYQDLLRKPSLLGLCLDYSGSMAGGGHKELLSGVETIFGSEAARLLVQPGERDVHVVMRFTNHLGKPEVFVGGKGQEILRHVRSIEPPTSEGTDLHACAYAMVATLADLPQSQQGSHLAGVVLMTDGRGEGDIGAFRDYYRRLGLDIPVHGILFGNADPDQLQALADLTRGRVFDGRNDLREAFREARGYQ